MPAIKLKEMFQAVAANARTFDTVSLQRRSQPRCAILRNGKINGVLKFRRNFRARSWPGRIRASRWSRTTRTNSPPRPWRAR